jgi:hypothetical protein
MLTIPVKELMTAAPPVNNIAVTRMLVMMPKTAKTLGRLDVDNSRIAKVSHLHMGPCAKSCFDSLKESMGIRSASLELNRNACKEENLHSCS